MDIIVRDGLQCGEVMVEEDTTLSGLLSLARDALSSDAITGLIHTESGTELTEDSDTKILSSGDTLDAILDSTTVQTAQLRMLGYEATRESFRHATTSADADATVFRLFASLGFNFSPASSVVERKFANDPETLAHLQRHGQKYHAPFWVKYPQCALAYAETAANIDEPIWGDEGQFPAVFIAIHCRCSRSVAVLLAHGADPLQRAPLIEERALREGSGLLFHAAASGSAVTAALLITKYGLDVNEVGPAGETPLHVACRHGNAKTVETLLRHGADPRCKDAGGCRPRQRISIINQDACAAALAVGLKRRTRVSLSKEVRLGRNVLKR